MSCCSHTHKHTCNNIDLSKETRLSRSMVWTAQRHSFQRVLENTQVCWLCTHISERWSAWFKSMCWDHVHCSCVLTCEGGMWFTSEREQQTTLHTSLNKEREMCLWCSKTHNPSTNEDARLRGRACELTQPESRERQRKCNINVDACSLAGTWAILVSFF